VALDPKDTIKAITGDVCGNPLFPILDDDTYDYLLGTTGGNIWQAATKAAIIISMRIAAFPSREKAGHVEVWNNYSTAYLAALTNIIKTPASLLSSKIIPYAGGISKQDIYSNDANQDNNIQPIYQGFDKGQKNYNHGNSTQDASKFFGIDSAIQFQGWQLDAFENDLMNN
jgi:hypothetical protein